MASWKEAAGRGGGPEGYRFGDLTRSLIGRVVGGRKASGTSVLKPRRSLVGRKYGWRRDLPDHRDQTTDFSTTHPALFGSLPASVDLRDGCPAPYNQGELGSCTANAIAAAFQFDQHKEEGVEEFMPSRLFIYYNERSVEGTVDQDSGAMIRDGVKSVHKLGVCPEFMCPYDVAKFTDAPAPDAYECALAHKATKYMRVIHTTRQMKSCLAAGFPFVFGFTVLTSFESDSAKTGVMPRRRTTTGRRPRGVLRRVRRREAGLHRAQLVGRRVGGRVHTCRTTSCRTRTSRRTSGRSARSSKRRARGIAVARLVGPGSLCSRGGAGGNVEWCGETGRAPPRCHGPDGGGGRNNRATQRPWCAPSFVNILCPK